MKPWILLAVIVCVCVGCGGDEGGDLGAKLDRVIEEKAIEDAISCECNDLDSCDSSSDDDDRPDPATRACMIRALETYARSAEYLDCIADAFRASSDCMSRVGACGSGSGGGLCDDVFDVQSARCGRLPEVTDDAVDECD